MDLIWLIPILPGLGAAINGLVGIRSFSRRTCLCGIAHETPDIASSTAWPVPGLKQSASATTTTSAEDAATAGFTANAFTHGPSGSSATVNNQSGWRST